MTPPDGRTAVISGASSGIGRGIALGFAEHDAGVVVIADIREDPKEGGPPTHELLQTETNTVSDVECDVTKREDLTKAIEAASSVRHSSSAVRSSSRPLVGSRGTTRGRGVA